MYIYICVYSYPHGFAHSRHRLSRAGSTTQKPAVGVLASIGLPKLLKRQQSGRQFRNNSGQISLGDNLGAHLVGCRVQEGTIYQKVQQMIGEVRKGRSTGVPAWKLFNDICKFRVLADTPSESSVCCTLLPRFCGAVAQRERGYSMFLSMASAHYTIWNKIGFVMILAPFRVPVGEFFVLFSMPLRSLFVV